MKRRNKIIGMLLAVVLSMGLNPVSSIAAENRNVTVMEMTLSEGLTLELTDENVYGGLYDRETNPGARTVMLTNCVIRMGYLDNTYLHMEFVTGSNYEATEIGVKDIKVQEKKGIFWNTIATSSGGSVENHSAFSGHCNCYTVVKGETYRVSCVHYAYINGSYYSLDNVTDGHKFG